jgi:hypothetical protein
MCKLLILMLGLLPLWGWADDVSPSVEDNIRIMDTDHDGQVTVTELRAYLQAKYGKGYQQALLEQMEMKSGTKSCGSPFSQSLY